MNKRNSRRFSLAIRIAIPLVFVAFAANAQNQGSTVKRTTVSTDLPEQEPPKYPKGNIRRGQEGWVRMSYIIAPDGSATDPLIIDSSGGKGFEEEARKASGNWRFAPLEVPGERPNNIVDIRSEIENGRDRATSNFMRRYVKIVSHLRSTEYEDARRMVNSAHEIGGWNLYESTMLWLMTGRVEGAEGNLAGKLEHYRRAHRIATKIRLDRKDRVELLEKIFMLEDHFGQYAEAMGTHALLKKALGEDSINAQVAERSAEIRAKIDSLEPIVAQATVYNPCDCDAGTPLWYYKPARRTFSFANLSGNVQSFEARCEHQRVQGPVEAGTKWTLAPEWGSCRVFVFGDDGATFEFVEHPTGAEDGAPTAVVEDDVLDRRSRGQRS